MSTTSSASASASYSVDIEAQNGLYTTLSAPMPVLTHEVRTPAHVAGPIDPMDDFFGYTLSSTRTHDSRHDENILPPYVEESNLPEYTEHAAEPVTLAMYLFKFGFLFPLFWIFGAFILFSPLREPPTTSDSVPAWMPEKTEAQRQQIIAEMRKVELKWGRRSLYALLITIVLATAAGVTAWGLTRALSSTHSM